MFTSTFCGIFLVIFLQYSWSKTKCVTSGNTVTVQRHDTREESAINSVVRMHARCGVRKTKHARKFLIVACINYYVTGAENIFERHTYVTESKPGVFLDGTICQLEGRLTPPWGKLFTSGEKECVSFSWNFNISKNLKKIFLGVPCL